MQLMPPSHCCLCEYLQAERGREKNANFTSRLTVPTENLHLALLSRMPSCAQHFPCAPADAHILDNEVTRSVSE